MATGYGGGEERIWLHRPLCLEDQECPSSFGGWVWYKKPLLLAVCFCFHQTANTRTRLRTSPLVVDFIYHLVTFSTTQRPLHPLLYLILLFIIMMATTGSLQSYRCASEDGSEHSDCTDVAPASRIILLTANSSSTPIISPTTFPHGLSRLSLNGATHLHRHDHSMPSMQLTVANLACLNATNTTSTQDPIIQSYEDPTDTGDVEYFWYCCSCGHGPWNTDSYVSCTYCNNHNKCDWCTVQAQPVKK